MHVVGAITEYIDVAQICLYAFWIFFAGLLVYLRREDKREGYPLESDRTAFTDRLEVQGYPRMPPPKTFKLPHGGTVTVPRPRDALELAAAPSEPWPGAPLDPTGNNAMLDGVGPGAYALRADTLDLTHEGEPRIVPMRIATDFAIEKSDPDPRGMPVLDSIGMQGGIIQDVWVDRAEPQIRYLEVVVASGRTVLLPIGFARFEVWPRCVRVRSILAAQFSAVPGHAHPDQVTLREEDRISAYYGGGTLYAEPSRMEPIL